MNKKEILDELEEKFKKIKEELGFKASLEELDDIFFIKEAVLSAGFVSEKLSRQMSGRIVEAYSAWNNYLHSLIMPNPAHLLNMNESKMFNEEERKKIMEVIQSSLALMSRNNVIRLTKDKKQESKFIDDSLMFWEESFKPELIKITEKINKGWEGK